MAEENSVQLRSLHAVIESRLTGPSVILITGARESDGAASLATAVTGVFRAGGASVALVRIAAPKYGVVQTALVGEIHPPDVGASRAELDEMVRSWRGSYDLVVVEASPLMHNPLAPRLASLADGVVIALQKGRSISAEDGAVAQLLSSVGANALGIITTSAPSRGRGWLTALVRKFSPSRQKKSRDAALLFSRS